MSEDGLVVTAAGRLRGVEREGVWQVLGVPYAASPEGRLRFRPPQPVEPWAGTREAGEYGPIAPQPAAGAGYVPDDPARRDEDCLSLNVYTPACDAASRPVMVFLHGGAFVSGTGSSAMYRGLALVGRGVVLVTINYRLGALGFLAHPCLAEPTHEGFGNWGLADQLAALAWVRDNISGFGGDPARVTLFGESAGAMSVADLLGAPAAAGLFRRAVLQSGAALASSPAASARVAEQLGGELGIGELSRERLSAVPADEIVAAQTAVAGRIDRGIGLPFQPVVDGGLLPVHPATAIAAGAAAHVELLVGTNADEFRFFSFAIPDLSDLDDRRAEEVVGAYLSGAGVPAERLHAHDLVEAYRCARLARGEETSSRELLEAIATDWLFRLPALRLADAQRRAGGRVRAYLFTWESPFAGGALRSCHGLELPFVFGTYNHPIIGLFAGTGPEADRLAATIGDCWASFAASGDPSSRQSGEWPAYEPGRRATMVLGTAVHLEEAPREAERAFLDERLGRYGVGGPIEGAEPASVALLAEVPPVGGALAAEPPGRPGSREGSGPRAD